MTKTELEQTVLDYFFKVGKALDRAEYRADPNVPIPYPVINRAYGSYLRFHRFMAIRFRDTPKPEVKVKKEVKMKKPKVEVKKKKGGNKDED